MNNELLLLIEKHTDTLVEHTKTKPQETLEHIMNKKMQTFSFDPPKKLAEEGKCLLGVTSFEATNSVFNATDGKISFSVTTPRHWISKSAGKTIEELNNLVDLRSENDIELHVIQVKKKGIILIKDYSLSSLLLLKMKYLKK